MTNKMKQKEYYTLNNIIKIIVLLMDANFRQR